MMQVDVALFEIRQAWRSLLRRPGYLFLATLTLALGLGTTILVFALLDQALMRPLPFPEPQRLVSVGLKMDANDNRAMPLFYRPVKEVPAFSSTGMVLGRNKGINISMSGHAEVAQALYADEGFLQTLGTRMAAGRNFNGDEDSSHGPPAVILGYDLWRRQFGGDPSAVGKTLLLEGQSAQIVGVLPRDFEWPDTFDLVVSLQPDLNDADTGTNQYIIGRVASGATVASASAGAEAAMRSALARSSISEDGRQFFARSKLGALPLDQSLFFSRSGTTLWLFLAAALCVLGVAAVNLANLMLLRSLSRAQDNAVRSALGASIGRLALPAFSEGVLIGLLGVVGGLAVAWAGLRFLGERIPPEWIRGQSPHLGVASFVFAVLVGLVVALVAALPAFIRAFKINLTGELVGGGRGGLSQRAGRSVKVLIVAQVGVAVILLTSAALFAHSLQKLSSVPMGFESRSISTFTLRPLVAQTPDVASTYAQTRRIIDALRRQPGVASVSVSNNLPTGSQFNSAVRLPDNTAASVQFRPITAEYQTVFGIPVVAGRTFDETTDVAGAEAVCMVNAQFVREFLDGSALGKTITLPGKGSTPPVAMRVVGVLGDTRQLGPAEVPVSTVFVPFSQLSDPAWQSIRNFLPLAYAVHLQPGTSATFEQHVRDVVEAVAPGQPIATLRTMDAVVATTTTQQKLNLLLVGIFSALALTLACVGLYAVMAMSVATRQQEFGVRAALGASPAAMLLQVLQEAGRQLGLGLAIGLVVALAVSRVLEGFLFDVTAADPVAIAAVLMVLGIAGTVAALVPAWRASRISPMQALRND